MHSTFTATRLAEVYSIGAASLSDENRQIKTIYNTCCMITFKM